MQASWNPAVAVFVGFASVASGCGRTSDGTTASSDGADAAAATGDETVGIEPAECDPLDDTCSGGKYCQYVDGKMLCVEEGTESVDSLCDPERCQRGTICLSASSEVLGPSCQPPCTLDGTVACVNARHACFQAYGDDGEELPFGVCRYIE